MATVYRLDGKTPVPMTDVLEWAQHPDHHKILASDQFAGARVSTIFLGVNYGISDKKPLLFETMVFGGKYDLLIQRYLTWDDAMAGHEKVLALVKECMN